MLYVPENIEVVRMWAIQTQVITMVMERRRQMGEKEHLILTGLVYS